ncbi:glycosyltransferase family 2 protein [Lachnospiraceae bacterium 54-11]
MRISGLVSCVTPVFNGEKYIGAMLDSILGQTYPYVEAIFVDDGSTDNTVRILESYREKFIERGYGYQIVRAPHRNASAAINRGLDLVVGEYLIWPDSDDILEPDSIKKRVDFLREHGEYSCVRSIMYYFDNEGHIAGAGERLGDLRKERIFFDIMEGITYVCCGCYMLKTEEFFAIYPERRIPEYPVGQNFQMLLPFMYQYKCPTIQERMYGVRVHKNSHSRRVLSQEEEKLRFRYFEELIDEIAEICGIHSFYERRRIICWKLYRRRVFARKHGKRFEMAKASVGLFLCGRSRLQRWAVQSIIHILKLGMENEYEKNLQI